MTVGRSMLLTISGRVRFLAMTAGNKRFLTITLKCTGFCNKGSKYRLSVINKFMKFVIDKPKNICKNVSDFINIDEEVILLWE